MTLGPGNATRGAVAAQANPEGVLGFGVEVGNVHHS